MQQVMYKSSHVFRENDPAEPMQQQNSNDPQAVEFDSPNKQLCLLVGRESQNLKCNAFLGQNELQNTISRY